MGYALYAHDELSLPLDVNPEALFFSLSIDVYPTLAKAVLNQEQPMKIFISFCPNLVPRCVLLNTRRYHSAAHLLHCYIAFP